MIAIHRFVGWCLCEDRGWVATAVGIGILMPGATTVFGQLQDSLNTIWGVTSKPSRSGWTVMIVQRLISFGMVLVVGFLLLSSLVLTTVLTASVTLTQSWMPAAPWVLHGADLVAGLALITVLFALLFKVLPDVRVCWREVWLGAIPKGSGCTLRPVDCEVGGWFSVAHRGDQATGIGGSAEAYAQRLTPSELPSAIV